MLAVAEAECAVVFAELVGGQLRAQQLARAVGADLQEDILAGRRDGEAWPTELSAEPDQGDRGRMRAAIM